MSDVAATASTRPARRRKAGARRDQFLQIRLTPDEAAEIESRATAARLTVSNYMRSAALNRTLKAVRHAALDPLTLHHLALLGSNMNQIARVLNATGDTERAASLDELVIEIRALLDAVRSHVR